MNQDYTYNFLQSNTNIKLILDCLGHFVTLLLRLGTRLSLRCCETT